MDIKGGGKKRSPRQRREGKISSHTAGESGLIRGDPPLESPLEKERFFSSTTRICHTYIKKEGRSNSELPLS